MNVTLIKLKQWWPSILAAIVALWGVFGKGIQLWVAGHAKISIALGMVAVVIAHLRPSPGQAKLIANLMASHTPGNAPTQAGAKPQ